MHQALEDRITFEIVFRRGDKTRAELAKEFSKVVGINERSANNFISNLETGQITSNSYHENKPKISELNLKRIAIYLNLLGVRKTDQLIKEIRENYPDFKYPIKSF